MKFYMKSILTIFLLFISLNVNAITLEEAINTALERSPVILLEKQKLFEAKEEKYSKKVSNFGKISAFGSYNKYNSLRPLVPLAPPIKPDVITSEDIFTAGVAYDVMLFNGFADISALKIAELSERNSKIKYSLTKEQLIFNVKSIYLKILTMLNQKKAAESYYKSLENLNKSVEKEVELGKKAKIDLLKVASDLENASFNIKNIENNIDSLKSSLAALIGIEKVDSVEPVYSNTKVKNLSDLKVTYKYKATEMELKKSDRALKKAKSVYYPKISFNAYYGSNYDLEGNGEELWQAGVTLKWVLFDFGNRNSQIKKAKISRKKAELKLKKTELELKSSITDAENKIKTAEQKIDSVKKQLDFLEKVKKAEQIKYEKGASNMYDLLYAYAKYQAANSNLIEAKYSLEIQKAYYLYLVAGEN